MGGGAEGAVASLDLGVSEKKTEGEAGDSVLKFRYFDEATKF